MLGWCSPANHLGLSSRGHGFESRTEQSRFLLFDISIYTTGIHLIPGADIVLKCYVTTLITHAHL